MPEEKDTIRDLISVSSTNSENKEPVEITVNIELTPLAQQMLRAEGESKTACLLILDGMDAGNIITIGNRPIIIGF